MTGCCFFNDAFNDIRWRLFYLTGKRKIFGIWYTERHIKRIAAFPTFG